MNKLARIRFQNESTVVIEFKKGDKWVGFKYYPIIEGEYLTGEIVYEINRMLAHGFKFSFTNK